MPMKPQTLTRPGTRRERGYDEPWLRLRAWFLRQPENVCCHRCEQLERRVTLATQVHHRVPFTSRDDPGRLDPANLVALCAPCHQAMHRQRRARAPWSALQRPARG